MTAIMKRRLLGEWAKHIMDNHSRGNRTSLLPNADEFRLKVSSMSCVVDDLAFINKEVDTYK